MNQGVNYIDWDYTTRGYIPKELNKNIKELIKNENSDTIKEFFNYLTDNHKEFSFIYRENLIPVLLQHQYFDIAEELFKNKVYNFDEKIAEQCGYNLGLEFEENFFNYWADKVKEMNRHSQSATYKKFWNSFLFFQFLRSEEVLDNLPTLVYVFDKVPFYIQSEYDIVNGYFIKSREDFFKNRMKSLEKNSQLNILQQIAILCGLHYSQFKSTFEEEFQRFPEMFDIFNKAQFYKNLNDKFELKPSTKKTKI